MQYAVPDFSRTSGIESLTTDIAASAPGHVHFGKISVMAVGAFPHQLAIIIDNLDFSVIAANLAIIALGVQFSIHDVIIDELP